MIENRSELDKSVLLGAASGSAASMPNEMGYACETKTALAAIMRRRLKLLSRLPALSIGGCMKLA